MGAGSDPGGARAGAAETGEGGVGGGVLAPGDSILELFTVGICLEHTR